MHVPLKNKKISILIPVFNRELYIRDCLTSALRQTYKNLSILVYDDGSTDSTASIVSDMSKMDKRIKLISGKENKGVGFARNVLLNSCETEIACWQDSDDLVNIHRVQKQMELFNEEKSPLVLSGYRIFKVGSKIDFTEVPCEFLGKGSCRASILFKVDKSVKFIERKILGGEDIAWFVQMREKYEVTTVPSILYYVRFHPNRIGWLKWRLKNVPKKDILGRSYKDLALKYGLKSM